MMMLSSSTWAQPSLREQVSSVLAVNLQAVDPLKMAVEQVVDFYVGVLQDAGCLIPDNDYADDYDVIPAMGRYLGGIVRAKAYSLYEDQEFRTLCVRMAQLLIQTQTVLSADDNREWLETVEDPDAAEQELNTIHQRLTQMIGQCQHGVDFLTALCQRVSGQYGATIQLQNGLVISSQSPIVLQMGNVPLNVGACK